MNRIETRTKPYGHREFNILSALMFVLAALASIAGALMTVGCSSDKGDTEPIVTVQVASVEKTTIQRTIKTQAVLFPRQQAAIVPKISAPVQKFLVKRGSPVHAGELLAVLENRDLSAAAQDTRGSYDQAQAAYETTTKTGLPEEIQKAEADAQQAQQALDALEKVFQSRQQLFDQGALPRKQPGNWNRPKASIWERRRNSDIQRFAVR